MTTERGLFSTISINHNEYNPQKLHPVLQLLNLRPGLYVCFDAENSNSECISYSYKVFSRIMNKKRLENDS